MTDTTPFIIRRRNVVTVMIFLELFLFSPLKDNQLFQEAFNTVDIFNSFRWGFVVAQFCGGFLATKFGGHQVIFYAVFVYSLFNFFAFTIFPYLVTGNWVWTYLVFGMLQGLIMPSVLVMWSKWLPPLERASSIGVALSGAYLGYIFGNQIQTYFITHYNPFDAARVFNYTYGALGLVWALVWKHFVRNSPELDPRITWGEKIFIRNALAGQSTHKIVPIPWKSMFTSTAVLAIIVTSFAQDITYFTVQYDIPLSYNDQLSSFITLAAATFAIGFAIDGVQKKFKQIRIGRLRRQFVCVSFILQIICIYMIYLLGFGRTNVSIFKSFALVFASLVYVRVTVSYLEIAPQFAGVLFGICSTLVTLVAVIRPFIIRYVNTTELSYEATFLVYSTVSSCFLFAGAVIYWFTGHSDILPWAVQEVVIYQT